MKHLYAIVITSLLNSVLLNGADTKSEYEYNPEFFDAVKNNDEDAFLRLFNQRFDDINITNLKGETLLMVAADNNYESGKDMVKLLLDLGADVNVQDRRGWTAFLNACYKGNKAIAHPLYVAGASTHTVSTSGWNAVLATCSGPETLSKDYRHYQTTLQSEVCNKKRMLLQWLLHTGHDASAIHSRGFNALSSLVKQAWCSEKLVQLLIQHGTTVDLPNIVKIAVQKSADFSTVRVLLDHGANASKALRVHINNGPSERSWYGPRNGPFWEAWSNGRATDHYWRNGTKLLVHRGATCSLNETPPVLGTRIATYGEQLSTYKQERNDALRSCFKPFLNNEHNADAIADLLISFADGSVYWVYKDTDASATPLAHALLAGDKQAALRLITAGASSTECTKIAHVVWKNKKPHPEKALWKHRIVAWDNELARAHEAARKTHIDLLYNHAQLPKDLARLVMSFAWEPGNPLNKSTYRVS